MKNTSILYNIFTIYFIITSFNIAKANNNLEICQHILELSNNGELENNIINSNYSSRNEEIKNKILSIIGQNKTILLVKKIDINHDNTNETLVIASSGTAHWQNIYILDESISQLYKITKNRKFNWQSDNLRWNLDFRIIKYNDRYYKISVNANQNSINFVNSVSELGKNNVENLICEFALTGKYVEKIVKSENDQICKLAKNQNLNYHDFNLEHNVTYESIKDYGSYESHPYKYAAKVDVDNDGKKEMIVNIKLSSGAGGGCDKSWLAEFNKKDGSIKNNKLNDIMPHPLCNNSLTRIFNYNKENYIELKFDEKRPLN